MTKEHFLTVEAALGFSVAVRKLSDDVKDIHNICEIVEYVKDLVDNLNFKDAAAILTSMEKDAKVHSWYEYDFRTVSTPPKPLSSFEDVEKFLE